jgi:hypothetical protein
VCQGPRNETDKGPALQELSGEAWGSQISSCPYAEEQITCSRAFLCMAVHFVSEETVGDENKEFYVPVGESL